MFRFIIVAAALLFSSVSFSADYSWSVSGFAPAYPANATPESLCDAVVIQFKPAAPVVGSVVSITSRTATSAVCNYKYNLISGGSYYSSSSKSMTRSGDNCPAGSVYNAVTFNCDVPACPAGQIKNPLTNQCEDPCASKAGTSKPIQRSGSYPDAYLTITAPDSEGKRRSATAQSGCSDGCLVSTVGQSCKTKRLVADGSGVYLCRGTAYFTGASCGTTPAPEVDESTDASPPQPETNESKDPCVYTTSQDGSQTCTSKTSTNKEGQNCGTVNGVQTCVDKLPSENGVDITTEVSQTTLSDGSTKITKTDTATTKKCAGYENCTTTSTTVTTTTTKDGNGTTTGTTGTCSGANCPDSNGDPDGNGDGFGDCVGGDCGEGEGEEGAPVEFAGPELEEVPGYGDTLTAFMDDVQGSPIATAVKAIRVPSGGQMPGGSAAMPWGSFDFSQTAFLAAEILDPLRFVFLALWAFAAIRILFTA